MVDKELAKKSGIVFTGSVMSQSFGLLFMILATRILSKSDYGYFSYIISMGTFFATIVSGGFSIAVTRYIAMDSTKEKKYIENGLLGITLLFIIASTASVIIFWPYWEIIVVIFPFSLINFYLGILRGKEKFKIYSLVASGRNLFKLIFLLIAMFLGIVTKEVLVWIYALAGIFIVFFVEYVYNIKLLSKPKYDPTIFRELLIFSIPLIIMTTSYSLTNNIGIYLLNLKVGKEAVASYKNALLLQAVYGFVSGAVGVVLLPKISSTKSFKNITKTLRDSIIFMLSLEVLIFIVSLFIGKQVIILLFSQKYADVFPLFIIMSFGTFAYSIERAAFSSFWNGIGMPNITMISSISAGVLVTLFSLLFIPIYGITGATYGYSIGFILAVLFVDFTFFIYYRTNRKFK